MTGASPRFVHVDEQHDRVGSGDDDKGVELLANPPIDLPDWLPDQRN